MSIMKVEKLLGSRKCPTMREDHTVRDACNAMTEHQCDAVVVKRGSVILGMVTTADVVRGCLGQGRRTFDTFVAEIMTPNPATINVSGSVSDALAMMTARRQPQLPVLMDGDVIGLLDITDIAPETRLLSGISGIAPVLAA